MQRQSRFNILLKKKGISPLIATVLLISFTVGIVSLVMIWGRTYVTEKTEQQGISADASMSCVNMKITVDKSCRTDDNTVLLTIRNLNSENIDAFIFRSDTVDIVVEHNEPLAGFTTSDITASETNIGKLSTLDIVPQKKLLNDWLPCSSAAKTVRITPCS